MGGLPRGVPSLTEGGLWRKVKPDTIKVFKDEGGCIRVTDAKAGTLIALVIQDFNEMEATPKWGWTVLENKSYRSDYTYADAGHCLAACIAQLK